MQERTLLGIKHHNVHIEVQRAPDLSVRNKQRIQTGINEHGDSSA